VSDDDTAQELSDAITRRLAERRVEVIAKQQARRAKRIQMAARRNLGLAARHATKLTRTDEGDQS
jgi:hypothetical protein